MVSKRHILSKMSTMMVAMFVMFAVISTGSGEKVAAKFRSVPRREVAMPNMEPSIEDAGEGEGIIQTSQTNLENEKQERKNEIQLKGGSGEEKGREVMKRIRRLKKKMTKLTGAKNRFDSKIKNIDMEMKPIMTELRDISNREQITIDLNFGRETSALEVDNTPSESQNSRKNENNKKMEKMIAERKRMAKKIAKAEARLQNEEKEEEKEKLMVKLQEIKEEMGEIESKIVAARDGSLDEEALSKKEERMDSLRKDIDKMTRKLAKLKTKMVKGSKSIKEKANKLESTLSKATEELGRLEDQEATIPPPPPIRTLSNQRPILATTPSTTNMAADKPPAVAQNANGQNESRQCRTECLEGDTGNFALCNSCDQYLTCAGATVNLLSCDTGLQFDPSEGSCNFEAEVKCSLP